MDEDDDSYALHDIHEELRKTVDACVFYEDSARLCEIVEEMSTELYWLRKWRDQRAKI